MVSNLPRKKLPKCNPKPLNLCYDGLISVPLCLGVFVLKRFAFLSDFLCVFAVKLHYAFAFSVASSLAPAATAVPIVQRRTQPSHPLQLCHFSAISRASRRHKMSIQRLVPSNPPVISAGNMQILHNVRILRINLLVTCLLQLKTVNC